MRGADDVEATEPGDACPSWCVADHDDAPASAAHVGRGRPVPVLQRQPRWDAGFDAALGEVVVVRGQDEHGSWVYVGDGATQWLEMSVESWRRVIDVVEGTIRRP